MVGVEGTTGRLTQWHFCDMLGYLLEKKRGDQHELEREKVFGDEYDHNEL